jgi:HNH endonuclease
MAKRTCTFPGCEDPHRGHGWCNKHLIRWRKHGDPAKILRAKRRGPAEQRFWSLIEKNGPIPQRRPELGPCWQWGGTIDEKGYGRLSNGQGKVVYAHRFAYQLLVGPIPHGLELDHLCRVPLCVKAIADECGPAHLEAVTHRVNCERGNAPAALLAYKARQTHCKRGHPWDEANTYWWRGKRNCRACKRDQMRRARGSPLIDGSADAGMVPRP